MGTAFGKTIASIGYEDNPLMRTGKFIRNCKACGLMLASFDIPAKRKKPVCPRCNGEGKPNVNDQLDTL
jgi:hypothetical protein